METVVEIETCPDFQPWLWYAGALQQHHYALLMLVEMFAFPDRRNAPRIWNCLDYVFEIPKEIPEKQKGRWVMTQVRNNMGLFVKARKLRWPAMMDEIVAQAAGKSTLHPNSCITRGRMEEAKDPSSKSSSDLDQNVVPRQGPIFDKSSGAQDSARLQAGSNMPTPPTMSGHWSMAASVQPVFLFPSTNSQAEDMEVEWVSVSLQVLASYYCN